MNFSEPRIEHRLRVSGVLLLLGLLVEAGSLLWSHPTAFLAFVFVGGLLLAAGVLLFLYSLLRVGSSQEGAA